MSKSDIKPIKRLILPTDKVNNYQGAKHLDLLVLALQNHPNDPRLKSQQGIAEIIQDITGGESSYTQSNIAKMLKKFKEHTIIIKDKVVEIDKDENGYYILTEIGSKQHQRAKIGHMKKANLFLNEKVFYNNPISTSTVFIFNVDKEHSGEAKNAFCALLDEEDIFDIVWLDDKLVLLLNPSSERIADNAALLKDFFKKTAD